MNDQEDNRPEERLDGVDPRIYFGAMTCGMVEGAAIGATMGTWLSPVIGTIVGGVCGAIPGMLGGAVLGFKIGKRVIFTTNCTACGKEFSARKCMGKMEHVKCENCR
ncbi:unnamed protein product [Echinostoma caproni]|uniref:DUF5862 domain-containing protein n=1 Tax=Echinostoma caproni TaxID=27848 RepID=A0A183A5H9_9TREM|nr:unnamed protein product [Echinostoma caproni]